MTKVLTKSLVMKAPMVTRPVWSKPFEMMNGL